ncbi:FkbM family methyltransferase [Pedococcus sp. KACC 23699]|uniref:FkbM family methyltransferase n=1 Tax=Pedococcus sp. KACC 23699 TaxID=3149228 RepID=A0AAU7JW37_9MICO
MPSLHVFLKRTAQKFGVDLLRFPQGDPQFRLASLLGRHHVDVVLDVGANEGQFASGIRGHGFRGRMVSFEPLPGPFRRLEAVASKDPSWTTVQCALGPSEAVVQMNVAANQGASSSMLPMTSRLEQAAPFARYTGTEDVAQRRLDDVVAEGLVGPNDRTFLKLDVQGYERQVLDGGQQLLGAPNLVGAQFELSFVPTYTGDMPWRDVFSWAEDHDMVPMSIDPGFTEKSGQMLQADVVFFKES